MLGRARRVPNVGGHWFMGPAPRLQELWGAAVSRVSPGTRTVGAHCSRSVRSIASPRNLPARLLLASACMGGERTEEEADHGDGKGVGVRS